MRPSFPATLPFVRRLLTRADPQPTRGVRRWVALTLAAGFTLTACADDGADTRAASSSGSGASASGMSSSHSGSSMDMSGVPAGVVEQYKIMEEEIAAEGSSTRVGDWRIAYIVEPAEPWFGRSGKPGTFRQPGSDETHHIEILPFEASTGRLVPAVPVRLEVLAEDGSVVDAKDLHLFHAEFFHYANNFSVPEPGTYRLRATLGSPDMLHHGERSETPSLTRGATVTFEDVRLERE